MHPAARTRVTPFLLGGLAITTLAACQPVWVKDGERQHEFATTANACIAETQSGYFGPMTPSPFSPDSVSVDLNRRAYLDRCIAAHGYRQVDPRNVPPGQPTHGVVAPGGPYLSTSKPD